MMLYAKIVLGLPVEGPFDYIVPEELVKTVKIGARAWVSFGTQRKVGYIVSLSGKTNIKKLKNISALIDETPILDENMLLLAKELSEYYCCSWGEAIEVALPAGLRKGKAAAHIANTITKQEINRNKESALLHTLDEQIKWNKYIEEIKSTLEKKQAVIIILADIKSVLEAYETIKTRLLLQAGVLFRKQPDELKEWLKIKEGKIDIVIGTRSSIFAPVSNLGLLIVDEEDNAVYKQEQSPHYHVRDVAFMRSDIEKAKLILSSAHPSLESYYLAKKSKIKYIFIAAKKALPAIKIMDSARLFRKQLISKYLEDELSLNLNSKVKTLLLIGRKGFSTFIACRQCGFILKCARCDINLAYHFKENILSCYYCNAKIKPSQLCPKCNSGYMKYSGAGTEKIESELARFFPQAKTISLLNSKKSGEADIYISVKPVLRQDIHGFQLVVVLSIDNYLNRVDFRSSEKAFSFLIDAARLSEKKVIIQTRLPNHYCFSSLATANFNNFYEEELKQREELGFPPFGHLAVIKLRSEKEEKTKEAGLDLFAKLKHLGKDKRKGVDIVSVNPGQPSKLRGNFYWNILIKGESAREISGLLKKYLKNISYSGIIITVDIDPI